MYLRRKQKVFDLNKLSQGTSTIVRLCAYGFEDTEYQGKSMLSGSGEFLCAEHPGGTITILAGKFPTRANKRLKKLIVDLNSYGFQSGDQPLCITVHQNPGIGIRYNMTYLYSIDWYGPDQGKYTRRNVTPDYYEKKSMLPSVNRFSSHYATIEDLERWTGILCPVYEEVVSIAELLTGVIKDLKSKEYTQQTRINRLNAQAVREYRQEACGPHRSGGSSTKPRRRPHKHTKINSMAAAMAGVVI